MIYEKCRDVLLKESELIMEAAATQEKVRLATLNREWDSIEDNINAVYQIEEQLAALENEREELFAAFGTEVQAGDPNRFYSIACKLPEAQRNELTDIYRSLKMETLKLRIANEEYMNYLTGIRSTINDFFDMAFPERGGQIYTPQGTRAAHDMRSMVLNQSF